MTTSREMFISLAWLFVCVLQFASPAQVMNYTVTPQNTTITIGKMATFRCAIAPANVPDKLNFTLCRSDNNYTLTCPGNSIKYPSMSLYGRCDVSSDEITATWDVSNTGTESNGTAFRCVIKGLDEKIGYLWIEGTGKYYLMLFGCVIGGFFGILIVFGLTYVSLKRSDKLQECFRGKDEEEDMTVYEETVKD